PRTVASVVTVPEANGMRAPAPVGPVGPVRPVAPVGPVAPVAPVGPVAPVAPVAPVGPVGPVAPVAPVGPVAPAGVKSGLKNIYPYLHLCNLSIQCLDDGKDWRYVV
ncbi:MAG: hypothetical protein PHE09_19230, partial [Oscillospiraceae bacterium]|nr:hypothetical protein [Oscillospiraceae bacterium]